MTVWIKLHKFIHGVILPHTTELGAFTFASNINDFVEGFLRNKIG